MLQQWLCLIAILTDFGTFALGTSIKQRLTLFTQYQTWNEAKTICEDAGMRLLQLESRSKSITVDKYIQEQWYQSIETDLWIGLHEVDQQNPLSITWTDCNSSLLYQDFTTGHPKNITDDTLCYVLERSSLTWISKRCDTPLQYICEENIGSCDFDHFESETGCSLNDKESADVVLGSCQNLCLDGAWPDARECWAIGFWDGYSGDDCWMFYSHDPQACVSHSYSTSTVTLYYKNCYIDSVNTTLPQMIISNNSIYPKSKCVESTTITTGITTDVTTHGQQTTSNQQEINTSTSGTTTSQQQTTITDNVSMNSEIQSVRQDTATTAPHDNTNLKTTTSSHDCQKACVCTTKPPLTAEQLKNIVSELIIDKTKTSINKRRYYSVKDDRSSAKSIGYVGVIFLTLTFSGIFLLDVPIFFKHIYLRSK